MVKKMYIGIELCNPMTYVFKWHVKILKIYMVKFNVSNLNMLKIFLFFLQIQSVYIHKPNIIFNKTVTKLVTILIKCFFPYLNTTSYLRKYSADDCSSTSKLPRSKIKLLKDFETCSCKVLVSKHFSTSQFQGSSHNSQLALLL